MIIPCWGGSTALPGRAWVWLSGWVQTRRIKVSFPKRLATVIGSWPSAWTTVGRKTLPILVGQLRIQQLALSLEHAAEDRVAHRMGGGFERVKGGFGLEGCDVGHWEIEAGKFGHLVAGGIVHAADQHANKAHAGLLFRR